MEELSAVAAVGGHGAETSNDVEVSPLAYAARVGDLEEVQQLLAAGAEPDAQDVVGETALFEAAASGDVSVVAALLLAGADPEQQSHIGGVPMDLASEAPMKALFKISCGQVITEAEKFEILSALDIELRQPILSFIQSLSGEAERAAAEAAERIAWARVGIPRRGPRADSPLRAESAGPAEEVEVIVSHAIQEGEVKLRVMSNATFADVKKAIVALLSRKGDSVPNLYLVRKEEESYRAYRDRDPIGNVRQVRMVGAMLPTPDRTDR